MSERCWCGESTTVTHSHAGAAPLSNALPAPPAVPTAGRAAQNSGETPVATEDARMDLVCPNCGASGSLPLGMVCFSHHPRPVPRDTEALQRGALAERCLAFVEEFLATAGNGEGWTGIHLSSVIAVGLGSATDNQRRLAEQIIGPIVPVAPIGDDMVERAARAFYEDRIDVSWDGCHPVDRETYRDSIRLALRAALGAPSGEQK